MLSVFLLYALVLISGLRLAGFLELPTRMLRWSMGFAVGCAQLLISVQGLSLFRLLGPGELLATNAVLTVAVWGFFLRKQRTIGEQQQFRLLQARDFFGSLNLLNKLLLLCAVPAWVITAAISPWVFPATDTYHLVMCLAWMQNGSILAFPVNDPRVVGVVFASEVLALPGFLYANSPAMFFAFSAGAAAGCLALVYALARACGIARSAATTAALAFFVGAPLLNSIWTAKSDFLLSSIWLLTSLHCLFESRRYPPLASRLLACSAFTFALSCGAKNTILLHAPAYAFSVLLILRGASFRFRNVSAIIGFGFLGAVASGVVWSYVQNHLWFGDWRGPEFLRATLSRNYDFNSVWTRFTRAVVTIAYDVGWLPNSYQPSFAHLTASSIRWLGGADRLPEDHEFYSMDLATFRPGAGMGMVGPFILLPTLVAAAVCSFRRYRSTSSRIEADCLQALCVFAVISFLVFTVMLRTQTIGISRLMLSWVAITMPLAGLIFRSRLVAWTASTAALATAMLTLVHSIGFSLQRNHVEIGMLSALKRTKPATYDIIWDSSSPEPLLVREPYTNRELYELAAARVKRPTHIGVIAGYNGEAFPAFSPDYSNQVVFLKDSRSNAINVPSNAVGYIIVEDYDFANVPPEALLGFEPLLRVSYQGVNVFALFGRAAD